MKALEGSGRCRKDGDLRMDPALGQGSVVGVVADRRVRRPDTLQIFPLAGTLPGSGSCLIAAQQQHSRNGQWQVQDWWRISRNRLRETPG